MPHLVIIGGGTAGLPAAHELADVARAGERITLVAGRGTFRAGSATPWISVRESTEIDLARNLERKGVEFSAAGARRLHPERNALELGDGSLLEYDVLVIAAGPQPAFEQIEGLGLDVESWDVDYRKTGQAPPLQGAPKITVTDLAAIIPGTRSQDRFVLVAPFDSRRFDDFEFVGANDGASGAAVVLEIARVLAADPLPYATEIVFLDGESPFSAPDGQKGFYQEVGSLGLASHLQEEGVSRVRLLVYLNRVGDADLRIARDLMSHRIYREEFWNAAAALDRAQAFPHDAAFENVGIGHPYLVQIGLRQIVTIEDTAFGGDQPPGLYANTAQDTMERCSPDSLQTVGVVVLAALDAISERLGKIDRFAGPLGVETWR